MADHDKTKAPRCGYGHTAYFGGCEECPYVDWPTTGLEPGTAEKDRRDDAKAIIRDLLAVMPDMPSTAHAALAVTNARSFLKQGEIDADASREPIQAPENGEKDPEWRAIRRSIDMFVGRVPTIGKHSAVHVSHIKETVARLDAAGDRAAADTIVWQCWYRALDRERERFLLSHAAETADRHHREQERPDHD